MDLIIDALVPSARRVEVVERKGLGHPDTLCDAIAERISVRLSAFYLERFGRILHHNVDKVLLCGGSSRPAFGGGEVTAPMEIYLAGRVTAERGGVAVPYEEIAVAACREILHETLPELDVARDARIVPRLRPGSIDLASLFERAQTTAVPLANDTSCGVAFAPLSDVERAVLAIEQRLTSADTRRQHPEIGPDVKVMGVRIDGRVELTVGCAFVGRHVRDLTDYVQKKAHVREVVEEAARAHTKLPVRVRVNAADDEKHRDVYLTVTGTSAEAGDDGEVGRGNRTSGLITPYRHTSLEAAAGKNPVSHVGKLYNVVAGRIAARLAEVPGVVDVGCLLVSEIGRSIDDPELAHVEVGGRLDADVRTQAGAIVRAELETIASLSNDLLAGRVRVF